MATAEFSKFAGILSAALSQHHLSGFEIAPLEFHHLQWQPTPVLLPGKSHGLRSLVGYSQWGRKESDTTERLHFTSAVKNPLASAGDAGLSPGSGRSLEKEMATHSSIPAWRTPRTEEAARLHTVHGASQESDMA